MSLKRHLEMRVSGETFRVSWVATSISRHVDSILGGGVSQETSGRIQLMCVSGMGGGKLYLPSCVSPVAVCVVGSWGGS